ncbi:winged helix-turn-helix domain-containing protein [Serratia fonticola]|uniref:winged helix-turn-helix domain-containing protein n=1 Tax=Serratia fonticola TaxID=47917 RepID=UPI0013778941|nr:winged helix-turn-helix domain-containing protein [Serratia fonticola]NCG51963.1 hypothetical protein [Serratia fonticola]
MKKIKISINDSFFYLPQQHMFISSKDEDTCIPLAIPASLCLNFLIEHQGEVIPPNKLISYVWTSRGMNVSVSTLNQNIYILRKSIRKAGGDPEIIKTISKRGFLIEKNIKIIVIEEEVVTSDVDDENNGAMNSSLINELDFDSVNNVMNNESVDNLIKRKSGVTLSFLLSPYMFLLFLVFFVITVHFILIRGSNNEVFDNYKEPYKMKDCNIMINKEIADKSYVTSFIQDNNLTCNERVWWYVTNYPPSASISIIMCYLPLGSEYAHISRKHNCVSFYSYKREHL